MSGELSDAQNVTAAKTTEIIGQIICIDSAASYQSVTDYNFYSFTQVLGFPNIPRMFKALHGRIQNSQAEILYHKVIV
ncbi:MAG: hypothetical protein WBV22_06370 [Anaerolineaceae bacterium]